MDNAWREDIKALQAAGYRVEWGNWGLTAFRFVRDEQTGEDHAIEPFIRAYWPIGACGPIDADAEIRNRKARELREKCGVL